MSDLISIYQTYDSFEANLIKAHFDNENIYCFLKTNDASGVLPHLGFALGGTEVFVRQEDLDQANTLLEQINGRGHSKRERNSFSEPTSSKDSGSESPCNGSEGCDRSKGN